MKDLPLVALRAFAVVCQAGGVRAAASRLGIAHSSVSRHIAELERKLAVTLVDPKLSNRGIVLTKEGEALGQSLLAAFGQIETAVGAVREKRGRDSVVISTTSAIAERWLLPLLGGFQAAHPRIEVSVVAEQRVDPLNNDDVDLAIRMGRGHWPDVDVEPLMRDRLVPVVSPDYWEQAGRPVDCAQLASMRLLHDRDPRASWELWRKQVGPADLDASAGPRYTSSELLIRAACLGHGVALVHERLVAREIAAGTLIRPFGALALDAGVVYWLVMPRQLKRRPAVDATARWLMQMAETPGAT